MKPLFGSVSSYAGTSTSGNRDIEAIKKAWEQMCNQLLETRSSPSSSLYGTPSLPKGTRQRKFAQVGTR